MEKTRIEWCDSTFNPVSGCRHECPFCYAERIAKRFQPASVLATGAIEKAADGGEYLHVLDQPEHGIFKNGKEMYAAYPYGFEPTFHRYRLNDLKTKRFGKTIFVCSTADLFGSWVPEHWITEVFEVCLESPEHRYLFLTKNPERYEELGRAGKLPEADNFWYGTTATDPWKPIFWSDNHHTFVSFEPVLEEFGYPREEKSIVSYTDWAIVGAETGNRKGKVIPKREWVEGIVETYQKLGKPVFMKDSMKPICGDDIITQLPWED